MMYTYYDHHNILSNQRSFLNKSDTHPTFKRPNTRPTTVQRDTSITPTQYSRGTVYYREEPHRDDLSAAFG